MIPIRLAQTAPFRSPMEKILRIRMHIDQGFELREPIPERIRADLVSRLDRFSSIISEVDIHLGADVGLAGAQDHRCCVLAARVEGCQPIAITRQDETLELAVVGAAEKLTRVLAHMLKRAMT